MTRLTVCAVETLQPGHIDVHLSGECGISPTIATIINETLNPTIPQRQIAAAFPSLMLMLIGGIYIMGVVPIDRGWGLYKMDTQDLSVRERNTQWWLAVRRSSRRKCERAMEECLELVLLRGRVPCGLRDFDMVDAANLAAHGEHLGLNVSGFVWSLLTGFSKHDSGIGISRQALDTAW